jgi:hypothetical protein
MSQALDIRTRIVSQIARSKRKLREPIAVRHVGPERPPIKPQKDYVGLRINQLFLHDSRQWFTTIEPAVYAGTEFLYAGGMRTDTFVVGLKKDEKLHRVW